MTSPLNRPLAFVDLETTGGTATCDRITEIGIITFDGTVSTSWSQLVNPQTWIPSYIEHLTGITNAMVADAPRFAEIADQVLARLDGHLFVAHNARFDYGFLKNEVRRAGMDFRSPVLCTVKLSRKLFPQHRRHNLDSLIERHGLVVRDRHRALGDAQAIFDFWRRLQETFDAEQIESAVKELTARPSLPSHLDADAIDQLPEGYGVYIFYGENELPLYVGKSHRLRHRVLSHFSSDHSAAKEMSISQQVRRIDCLECAGELEALLTEARLVRELQPTINRQLRRHRELCSWQLGSEQSSLLHLRLVYASDLDLGRQDHLYGLFKSRKQAHAALIGLAKEYGLCLATLGLEKTAPGKPCFARQLKRCRGTCVGEESQLQHGMRLAEAISKLKVQAWPFQGPALLAEGPVQHVIDAWCYLGTARTQDEMFSLLESGLPQFDKDTYRILVKHLGRMQALAREAIHAWAPAVTQEYCQ